MAIVNIYIYARSGWSAALFYAEHQMFNQICQTNKLLGSTELQKIIQIRNAQVIGQQQCTSYFHSNSFELQELLICSINQLSKMVKRLQIREPQDGRATQSVQPDQEQETAAHVTPSEETTMKSLSGEIAAEAQR